MPQSSHRHNAQELKHSFQKEIFSLSGKLSNLGLCASYDPAELCRLPDPGNLHTIYLPDLTMQISSNWQLGNMTIGVSRQASGPYPLTSTYDR